MRRMPIALVVVVAFTVSGCQYIHRRFHLSDGRPESLAIDAKQRVVLAKSFSDPRVIACAEPSPDALSVISTALAARAEAQQYGAGEFSMSTAEAALNIGLRTQSIQLLRDAMYRICEAYFNGALNAVQTSSLQKRYRDAMIGLLAIEQLTGATMPKPAVVYAGSEGNTGKSLLAAQEALEGGRAAKKKADDEVVAKQTALDEQTAKASKAKEAHDQESDATKKAELKKKWDAEVEEEKRAKAAVDAAKKAAQEAGENVTALEEKRNAARATAASASAGGILPSTPATMGAATAEHVSEAVVKIVETVTGIDYSKEDCIALLAGYRSQRLAAALANQDPTNRTQESEQFRVAEDQAVEYCKAVLARALAVQSPQPSPNTP